MRIDGLIGPPIRLARRWVRGASTHHQSCFPGGNGRLRSRGDDAHKGTKTMMARPRPIIIDIPSVFPPVPVPTPNLDHPSAPPTAPPGVDPGFYHHKVDRPVFHDPGFLKHPKPTPRDPGFEPHPWEPITRDPGFEEHWSKPILDDPGYQRHPGTHFNLQPNSGIQLLQNFTSQSSAMRAV